MIETFRSEVEHFDRQFLSEESGRVQIEETDELGRGEVSFDVEGSCLVLRGCRKPPQVRWIKVSKCADGAVIRKENDRIELHLVELKSDLTTAKWYDAREQFKGMYLNAIALLRYLREPEPHTVICYLAYREVDVRREQSSAIVLQKVIVGTRRTLGAYEEWERNVLNLPHGVQAQLRKVLRINGNAHCGEI